MSVYVVAQSETPIVWCPPWCERTDQHVPELADWEGRAVHQGWWPTAHGLAVGRTLLPGGEVDEDVSNPQWADVTIHIHGREMTLAEAEEFARMLDEVIVAAQVEQARTR